ncbi:MAG: PIN domain-containing protein [Acidaminococcaceae bacterium]|nr:PIN domain-containing protein [Acidaminococcaceae bacterium]
MRVMIDTNIILDVLLRRDPFFADSREVLKLCEERKVQGFVSASAITDLFYITRKALGSVEDTYRVINAVLNIVRVLTVTNTDVLNAFQVKARDFEDRLMATCAKSNKCEGIVTRNKRDFADFGIALYSPEEMILMMK